MFQALLPGSLECPSHQAHTDLSASRLLVPVSTRHSAIQLLCRALMGIPVPVPGNHTQRICVAAHTHPGWRDDGMYSNRAHQSTGKVSIHVDPHCKNATDTSAHSMDETQRPYRTANDATVASCTDPKTRLNCLGSSTCLYRACTVVVYTAASRQQETEDTGTISQLTCGPSKRFTPTTQRTHSKVSF